MRSRTANDECETHRLLGHSMNIISGSQRLIHGKAGTPSFFGCVHIKEILGRCDSFQINASKLRNPCHTRWTAAGFCSLTGQEMFTLEGPIFTSV